MYTFPAGLTALIATGWYRAHPAVIVKLGDGGTVLKYSTVSITVGSDIFVNNLKLAGAARQSLTRASDKVSLEIFNADSNAGLALIDPTDALEGATATFSRIYVNPDNSAESYLVEEISGVVVVDEGGGAGDEIISLTIVSDTDALKSLYGDLPMLKSCANTFKNPNEGCPYTGALTTCDLTFDGANGCRAHFNEVGALEVFGGHARDLDFVSIENAPDTGSTGGGGGSGSNGDGSSSRLPDIYDNQRY